MAQYFEIHPNNPQMRLIHQAVQIIKKGGVIAYPTDSSYAIACHIGDRAALNKIRRIRQLDDKHNFTLVCKDMAQVSTFSKVSNDGYRLIKTLTPGSFTFILKATREVPKKLQHKNRKTVGIRILNNPVAQTLLQELDEPLFSSTLILPGDKEALNDPYQIRESLEHELDLIIDVGMLDYQATTIINVSEASPEIIRQGKGQAPMLA